MPLLHTAFHPVMLTTFISCRWVILGLCDCHFTCMSNTERTHSADSCRQVQSHRLCACARGGRGRSGRSRFRACYDSSFSILFIFWSIAMFLRFDSSQMMTLYKVLFLHAYFTKMRSTLFAFEILLVFDFNSNRFAPQIFFFCFP